MTDTLVPLKELRRPESKKDTVYPGVTTEEGHTSPPNLLSRIQYASHGTDGPHH